MNTFEHVPLEKRVYDGDRAREVLENPAFAQAFSDIERDLIESWKNIPSTSQNVDARERIHLSLTMLGKVRACLQSSLETGRLAALDLEHKNKVRRMLEQTRGFLGV